ncbi:MAG: 4Fe-4S binding protein [Promethearchaeota archaeon]
MSLPIKDKFPIISFTRKMVQLFSFIVINYVALEIIFDVNFSVFKNTVQVFPFLQSARDPWATGAGVLEFILYSLGHGEFPYLLFGLFFLFVLLTARFSCGWICPVGFILDLLSSIPKRNKRMSIETDRALKKVKNWVFAIVFIFTVALGLLKKADIVRYTELSFAMGTFLTRPLGAFSLSDFLFYTLPTDIRSLWQSMSFKEIFQTGWSIAGFIFYIIILGISIYYPRFYCRTLCPYGAISSYISEYSLLKFSRNPVKCVGRKECGLCEKVCPMQIRILDESFEAFTGRGECILCGRCKEACPYDAIKLTFG